jgi:hypothetical protein
MRQQWMTRRNSDHQRIIPYWLNDDVFADVGRLGESSVIQAAAQAFHLFRQGNLEQADFDVGFLLATLVLATACSSVDSTRRDSSRNTCPDHVKRVLRVVRSNN